jgi:glycerol kinase
MSQNLAPDHAVTAFRATVPTADPSGRPRPVASTPGLFGPHHRRPGWVGHLSAGPWSTATTPAQAATAKVGTDATCRAAIGITNQRRVTPIWHLIGGKVHAALSVLRNTPISADQAPAANDPAGSFHANAMGPPVDHPAAAMMLI